MIFCCKPERLCLLPSHGCAPRRPQFLVKRPRGGLEIQWALLPQVRGPLASLPVREVIRSASVSAAPWRRSGQGPALRSASCGHRRVPSSVCVFVCSGMAMPAKAPVAIAIAFAVAASEANEDKGNVAQHGCGWPGARAGRSPSCDFFSTSNFTRSARNSFR